MAAQIRLEGVRRRFTVYERPTGRWDRAEARRGLCWRRVSDLGTGGTTGPVYGELRP